MAENDLHNLILRPGELHILITVLRTIGCYVEDSGLDTCWLEADIYGPATIKQILEGNHVKRGEAAHLVTLQALFALYQKAFFQSSQTDYGAIADLVAQVVDACSTETNEDLVEANMALMRAVDDLDVAQKMAEFDKKHEKIPLFKVMKQYMHMVTEMLQFTRAVRTGDWGLHHQALHSFTKYFFAHDRLNYSRMIPPYLAEMEELPRTDPEIYSEFLSGNWVVNKNQVVPFCAIGADHGLEQVNRSMKVTGGLVGITLNQAARTKFFLIAPEMANLANQAKNMAAVASKSHTRHHSDTLAVLSREDKNVQMLTETIEKFSNPFTEEGQDLFNIVTKVVMPDSIKEDICDQPIIGQRLFDTFVTERIKTGKINIWSTIKKRKLGTWKTNAKKINISTKGKLVELREDRSLFARLLVACRTRPEIDLKETIGIYEFSVVPRSLFAADETMLRCSRKSALMPILEKLPSAGSNGEGINSTPVQDISRCP